MTAYLLIDIDVHDPKSFTKYQTNVPALVARHGGELIVRDGAFEVIEGAWRPTSLVIIRFPDRQAIRNLFDDPEYAALKALRQSAASSSFVAVDGVD